MKIRIGKTCKIVGISRQGMHYHINKGNGPKFEEIDGEKFFDLQQVMEWSNQFWSDKKKRKKKSDLTTKGV